MQGKMHDRVVEMRLCFFSGKVGDYKVLFKSTRKCRSTVIDGALNAAAASFARAGSGMNKSEGEMLDAIDKQIEAEKELAKSMADACRQFTSSIQNAAQSFQVLDASLSSKMGIKKRK